MNWEPAIDPANQKNDKNEESRSEKVGTEEQKDKKTVE